MVRAVWFDVDISLSFDRTAWIDLFWIELEKWLFTNECMCPTWPDLSNDNAEIIRDTNKLMELHNIFEGELAKATTSTNEIKCCWLPNKIGLTFISNFSFIVQSMYVLGLCVRMCVLYLPFISFTLIVSFSVTFKWNVWFNVSFSVNWIINNLIIFCSFPILFFFASCLWTLNNVVCLSLSLCCWLLSFS